ncbi:MAG: aquaporin family protein [Rhodobacterales bacterium]|nr:aquaporin family protein [Rhodobacterales bacterium]
MRSFVSEFLGTLFLVATVVGSGIMADNLSMGNHAVALLANAISTGAILYVLIIIFSELSGAHFNPVVSLIMFIMKKISLSDFLLYVFFQIIGGVLGTFLAHFMFEMSIIQLSTNVRTGSSQYLSEVIAAFGLVLTILLGLKYKRESVATLVALYITAAYWFTSSTSFANPAVTIARTFTDTFSGIQNSDTVPFIMAQILGGLMAYLVFRYLSQSKSV